MNYTCSQEMIVEIPSEAVTKSCGFALDIGGSAVKVAYRHKDDWEEFLRERQRMTTAKVRLRVFAKEDLEDALKLLLEKCHISRSQETAAVVYCTGNGCYQYKDVIQRYFNVTADIVWEMDCFFKSFVNLSRNLPRHKFEYIRSEKQRKELETILHSKLGSFQRMKKAIESARSTAQKPFTVELDLSSGISETKPDLPIAKTIPDLYPCLVYLISSCSALIVVHGDHDYELIPPLGNGGRAFLGLGSLLCGSKKSYDELIDLAEKGTNTAVDETLKSITESVPTDIQTNMYAGYNCDAERDESIYCFGRVVSAASESFKTEDIIRSLLTTEAKSQIASVFPTILTRGLKHIFLVGSFFNRELVRTIFDDEFARQKVEAAIAHDGKGLDADIHFVKAGGYLGCIGAFLGHISTE